MNKIIKQKHNSMPYKIKTIRWSAIGAWEYSKEQWHKTYVLGQQQSSPELTFGSMVDAKIQNDPTFIPSLPRYPEMQHSMRVNFDGIVLTGTADGIDFNKKLLFDFKTGAKPWTKSRADETGQLSMYLLMLYITDKKIKPEEWKLGIHWLPTKKSDETGDFKPRIITFRDDPVIPITFETKRTMADLLKFAQYIKQTIKSMENYVNSLSTL